MKPLKLLPVVAVVGVGGLVLRACMSSKDAALHVYVRIKNSGHAPITALSQGQRVTALPGSTTEFPLPFRIRDSLTIDSWNQSVGDPPNPRVGKGKPDSSWTFSRAELNAALEENTITIAIPK